MGAPSAGCARARPLSYWEHGGGPAGVPERVEAGQCRGSEAQEGLACLEQAGKSGWPRGQGSWGTPGEGGERPPAPGKELDLCPAGGEGYPWACSRRLLLTNQGSCCQAEWVGRSSVLVPDSSPRDPKRPGRGPAQLLYIAVQPRRPAALDGNPQKHRETVEKRAKPPSAHPVAKAELMHMQRGPTQKAFRLAAWRSRGRDGNLYVTLRCTQLGSDWHRS